MVKQCLQMKRNTNNDCFNVTNYPIFCECENCEYNHQEMKKHLKKFDNTLHSNPEMSFRTHELVLETKDGTCDIITFTAINSGYDIRYTCELHYNVSVKYTTPSGNVSTHTFPNNYLKVFMNGKQLHGPRHHGNEWINKIKECDE